MPTAGVLKQSNWYLRAVAGINEAWSLLVRGEILWYVVPARLNAQGLIPVPCEDFDLDILLELRRGLNPTEFEDRKLVKSLIESIKVSIILYLTILYQS